MRIDANNENNLKTEEFIITDTNIPILRAGVANLYLLAVVSIFPIGYLFAKGLAFGFLIWIAVITLALKIFFNYLNSACKVFFGSKEIIIIKPLSNDRIKIEDIISSKLLCQRLNSFIQVKFKIKNKYLRKSFNVIVMRKTNFGDFVETTHLLRKIISKYGQAE